jgi:D-amino-acid dehydrogenase
MKQTVIIGGGIVGLFTAYYLVKKGVEVVVIDKSDMRVNTSTGNAGMIVPSHIVPLSAPGMISKGISWMFSSKSPFYIHPKLDYKLLEWSYLFYRSANQGHVDRSIPFLKELSLLSLSLYKEFKNTHQDEVDLELAEKGLMMIYQTPEMEKEELAFAKLAKRHGLDVEVLTPQDISKIEPHLKLKARGAVLFPGDAHLSPSVLYHFLKNYLMKKGVDFKSMVEVEGFEKSGGKVSHIITNEGTISCENVILCGGAWSSTLAKKLGFRLPMMGGKGYSFVMENQPQIMQASILTEKKVAVSPYGNKIRFGGTLEIAGTDEKINLKRVRGIFESINTYYPDFKANFPTEKDIWSGLRPCSPDGMPYIGAAPGYENVWFGTGHGMMGLSLAPATGLVLSELSNKNQPEIELSAFEVGRYA